MTVLFVNYFMNLTTKYHISFFNIFYYAVILIAGIFLTDETLLEFII